jgi:ribonuclease BN (tRNA processing enzyme)
VHDAQFVSSESRLAHDFGHSTVDEAVEFALDAGVGELVLFHHAPGRTDTAIDDILGRWRGAPVRVTVAFEGRDVGPGV